MVNVENTDVEKPIFAYYINVDNIPRQRAEEKVAHLIHTLDQTDLQCIIVPNTKKDSIECIYGGKYHTLNDKSFQRIIDTFEEMAKNAVTNPLKDEILNELKNIKTLVERNHLIDDLL